MLVSIDGRTILVAKGIMTLAAGAGLAFSSLHLRQVRSLKYWAVAFTLIGLGAVTQAAHGLVPLWLSPFGACLAVIAGAGFLPLAMADDCNQRPKYKLVLAIQLCSAVLFLCSWFIWPSMPLRIVAIRACLGCLFFLAAHALWQQLRQQRLDSLGWCTLLPLLLLGLSHSVVVLNVLWKLAIGELPQEVFAAENLDRPMPLQLGALVWWLVSSIGLLFSLLLRVAVRLNSEVQRQADIDLLTGVYTRRAFVRSAELELGRRHRGAQPLALLFLDLDHFKRLNDQYGHQAGDAALAHFAQVLQTVVRKTDLVGRYGGEEFCLLLPDATPELAGLTAERHPGVGRADRRTHLQSAAPRAVPV